jgi:hypothetical protein
MLSSFQARVAV